MSICDAKIQETYTSHFAVYNILKSAWCIYSIYLLLVSIQKLKFVSPFLEHQDFHVVNNIVSWALSMTPLYYM